jgi:hypothetical protein
MMGQSWFATVGYRKVAAGAIGSQTIALPDGERGQAAGLGWVASTIRTSTGSTLHLRRPGGGASWTVPTPFFAESVAFAGGAVYLGGFDRVTDGDPGIWRVSLETGELTRVVEGSNTEPPRRVVASRSGRTVVSAVCDGACQLEVLDTSTNEVRKLGAVDAFLRTTGDAAAIVGPDPATWVAGIDLDTGRELWRREAAEVWLGYVTTQDQLIQAFLVDTSDGPSFRVGSIAISTGGYRELYRELAQREIGLWPDVSSDDYVAIGPGFNIADGLDRGAASARADLIRVSDGGRHGAQLALEAVR